MESKKEEEEGRERKKNGELKGEKNKDRGKERRGRKETNMKVRG